MVDARLRKMVPISQSQWEFVPNKFTLDAIFITRGVWRNIEKTKALLFAIHASREDLRQATPGRALEVPSMERCSGSFDHGHKET